ncbi:FAD-dependent oxidoreductase [Streptomyces sp. NPDC007905]|uniref:FAD-dependent oxidoreductase n=1 Tax=Streptomyces sp. NPDC007905 TaxID=3364788 RepID=UPI0036E00D78
MIAERRVGVLVVGAGPAGLAVAASLAAAGVGRVEVVEREAEAGGVPRYCAHGGFGTWTRPLTGPGYARLLAEAARRAGAVIRTGVTVLDWAAVEPTGSGGDADGTSSGRADAPASVSYGGGRAGIASGGPGPVLTAVGPGGLERIAARAVVLATGARERPRAARLVPGTRPAGVYTTGELQQSVHLYGQPIGTRAVVVGAEEVSYAAAGTLRAAGTDVVALVTVHARAQVPPLRARSARLGRAVPLLTDTTVTEVLGHGRLSGVRVRHRDGRTATLPCDTIVFTGDFVAENELAHRAGITLGTSPHTSRPDVFAAGGVLRPGQRARAATRDGAAAAGAVLEWLGADDRRRTVHRSV